MIFPVAWIDLRLNRTKSINYNIFDPGNNITLQYNSLIFGKIKIWADLDEFIGI